MKKEKRIPFDIDLYKKGDFSRIERSDGKEVRIICTDAKNDMFPIVALVPDIVPGMEKPTAYTKNGYCEFASKGDETELQMVIEEYEPEKCTLIPFDRVLVRDDDVDVWGINFFDYILPHSCSFKCLYEYWTQCVPYNEETKFLRGTNKKAPSKYINWPTNK